MPKTPEDYLGPIKAWMKANDLELVRLRLDDRFQYVGFQPRVPTVGAARPVAVLAGTGERVRAEAALDLAELWPTHPADRDYTLCRVFAWFQTRGVEHLCLVRGRSDGPEEARLACAGLGAVDPAELEVLRRRVHDRARAFAGRLRRAGLCVLAAGLAGAALVFGTAGAGAPKGVDYQVIGGRIFTSKPSDSRQYLHDMEMYGGKSNLLASEISEGFGGLWQGRSLAYTLAGLSSLVAAGLLAAGRLSDPDRQGRAVHRPAPRP